MIQFLFHVLRVCTTVPSMVAAGLSLKLGLASSFLSTVMSRWFIYYLFLEHLGWFLWDHYSQAKAVKTRCHEQFGVTGMIKHGTSLPLSTIHLLK